MSALAVYHKHLSDSHPSTRDVKEVLRQLEEKILTEGGALGDTGATGMEELPSESKGEEAAKASDEATDA